MGRTYSITDELQDGYCIYAGNMQEMLDPIHRKDGVAVQRTTQ